MIKQLIKKQRGVTLSMLLITIILISILIGVTVTNLDMGNDIKEYNYMCADIELLDSKVLMYYNENKGLPISSKETIDVGDIVEFNPNDNDNYYEIDLSKLNNVSLNFGKGNKENKDIYIINEQSYTVYYLKGVVYEGTKYNRPMRTQGGGKGPEKTLLPAEYQQVEYIQSTGTQYINTGILDTANETLEYNIDIQIDDDNERGCFGANDGSYISFVNNTVYAIWENDFFENDNKRTQIKISNVKEESSTYFYQDSILKSKVTNNKVLKGNNFTVFAVGMDSSGSVKYNSKCKLYSLNVIRDGILIGDFIPCYRKSDNKPGLYDLVYDKFYSNAGTGTFTVGGNV